MSKVKTVWKNMSRKKFFTVLVCIILAFIFIKIYQHNILIKLTYKKQRLEKKKNKLKRKKNHLTVKLFKLKNYEKIEKIARNKFGMQPLTTSQIITVTKT
jgi:cell division protein FtsL